MSTKSTFENIVRALLGVPSDQLDVYLDTIKKVQKAEGHAQLAEFNKTLVPNTTTVLTQQVGNPVTIPPSDQPFIAAEKFVVNTGKDAELKISSLGRNFKNCFLGTVEKPFAGSQLKVQKLNRDSRDNPILDELGGEEKAETTLYEMFEFLKTAPCAWYIFYIKDARGFLRAVGAHWDVGVWRLFALRLNGPRAWGTDHHVVSRN